MKIWIWIAIISFLASSFLLYKGWKDGKEETNEEDEEFSVDNSISDETIKRVVLRSKLEKIKNSSDDM